MGTIDKIELAEKHYYDNHGEEAEVLLMDPYSYAGLIEELGIDLDKSEAPTRYHGYKITVEPDEDNLVRLI